MSKISRCFWFAFTFLCFGLVAGSAFADSFDMEKDGKKYHCEQISDSGGSCWDKCPYGFGTCKQECGGGDGCWAKCPYGFGTCKQECGMSRSCWDKCPYGFGTCKQECGGGEGCWAKCPYGFGTCKQECGAQLDSSLSTMMRFELGRAERVKAEEERLNAERN